MTDRRERLDWVGRAGGGQRRNLGWVFGAVGRINGLEPGWQGSGETMHLGIRDTEPQTIQGCPVMESRGG